MKMKSACYDLPPEPALKMKSARRNLPPAPVSAIARMLEMHVPKGNVKCHRDCQAQPKQA